MIIDSIEKNTIITLLIWGAGTTIIGMPIVFGIVLFNGFCLGYTISAINFALGTYKGISSCIALFMFQNIFFIPAIITMGVSSINLYKSIVDNRNKENIKIGIIKHSFTIIFMYFFIIISCLIENTISLQLLKLDLKYFF